MTASRPLGRTAGTGARRPTVMVANPSAATYGADLQMLESVRALRDRGWRVVVVVPDASGPLVPRLEALGAAVEEEPFPVLRRADLSPRGVTALARGSAGALAAMCRVLDRVAPDLLYVNTVTLPWWLLAARWRRVPAVCHVHEAESRDPGWVRRALAAPLVLADAAVVNSRATMATTAAAAPYLRRRIRLVTNGVRGPSVPPGPRVPGTPYRLVVVGRITPRKAPHTALEATALLRGSGRDVVVELCGTPGPGHEGYFGALCARAERPDLAGAVTFSGHQAPIWPALERADALVAPSLGESFGNAVVEAQLSRRPVVATAVQGHEETVEHGITGLLVPAEDPAAMAAAVVRLMDEPGTARQLALLGLRRAALRYDVARYAAEVAALVGEVAGVQPARSRRAARRSDLDVVQARDQLTESDS